MEEPIYNMDYHIWRDNEYLGVATWTEDENIGDSFQMKVLNKKGQLSSVVFMADYYMLVSKTT